MKKQISVLAGIFLIFSSFSCHIGVSEDYSSDLVYSSQSEIKGSITRVTKIVPREEFVDCNVAATDLGSWQNSVNIPAENFSSMSSDDYLVIKTEANYSNDDRQLQIAYSKGGSDITVIGGYGSLSDSTYLGEWKCYTLYSGWQDTKFYPSASEVENLKAYGLLIKGKGVKVTSVKIHTVVYEEVTEEIVQPDQPEVIVVDGITNCNVQVTDLGAWQNSVTIEKAYFTNLKSDSYVLISTEANYSNDDRQLQVCYSKGDDNIAAIGSYGSLSDSTYLGEWKCYTLYSGNQETKFYPSSDEIEALKNYGLIIKGKGVKVTSVKVVSKIEVQEPVEEEIPEVPDTPVVPETPVEEEDTPVIPEEKIPVDNGEDSVARLVHDCKLGASDLGDAWEWSKKVDLSSSHFADMEAGDFIIITTAESKTSKAGTLPQIKLGTSVNWNLQVIGNAASCSNVEYYNEEYNTYTLKSAAQTTRYTPTAEEVALLNSNGLIIQGQGVTVTKVTVHTKDYSAENPNNYGDSVGNVTSTLCDPQATNNAKLLYNFIKKNYGSKVITGQMENAWDNSFKQLDKVYADTGKYPALMGFDFLDYTIDWAIESGFNVQTERAINFWNGKDYKGKKISDSNGIVTFCWHWLDPMNPTATGSYKPEQIDFRIPYDLASDTWKTSTAEYAAMMRDMDLIATELLKLQEAGVPVIWRPFHEGAGNLGVYNGGTAWFWWGAGTCKADATNEANCAEAYIAMWKMMYQYFTETKGIHNLIWLWNGQNAKFYPGDAYVDMIGDDIYKQRDYSSQSAAFNTFKAINSSKPVALSECGTVPSLENMKNDGAMWSFFMVWNDAQNSAGGSDNFWNSDNHNPLSHRQEIYNSKYAITLDDVGCLTNY